MSAQWVKRWPTDLAVVGSSPPEARIFPVVIGVLLHTAIHYHLLIDLIYWNTVEKDVKSQGIHPPIPCV